MMGDHRLICHPSRKRFAFPLFGLLLLIMSGAQAVSPEQRYAQVQQSLNSCVVMAEEGRRAVLAKKSGMALEEQLKAVEKRYDKKPANKTMAISVWESAYAKTDKPLHPKGYRDLVLQWCLSKVGQDFKKTHGISMTCEGQGVVAHGFAKQRDQGHTAKAIKDSIVKSRQARKGVLDDKYIEDEANAEMFAMIDDIFKRSKQSAEEIYQHYRNECAKSGK